MILELLVFLRSYPALLQLLHKACLSENARLPGRFKIGCPSQDTPLRRAAHAHNSEPVFDNKKSDKGWCVAGAAAADGGSARWRVVALTRGAGPEPLLPGAGAAADYP